MVLILTNQIYMLILAERMITLMRYTYETIENSSYVVATFSTTENADNNQLQILTTSDLKNIIKPSCKVIDGETIISYNITSKISLEQATAKRKISKNGFINIIEGAVSAFEDIEKNGLFSSGIVFDEKNVYVKAGTYQPCFMYLPCNTQVAGIEPLKNFILSLIMGSKIERINDGFIQALFDTLNNPNLCADDLRELCNEQTKGKMRASKLAKNARFSVITPTMIDSESEILRSVYKKPEPQTYKPKDALQENHSDKQPKVQPNNGKLKKYIFLFLQLVIAGLIIVISKSGFFDNADGTLNIKYLLGIIAALCVVDFIIYRELFTSDKAVNDEEKDDISSISSSTAEKKPANPPKSYPAPSPIYKAPQSLEQIYAGAQNSEFDDTALLEEENPCAHLEFFENGIFKKIKLDNDVVRVGKLSSQCDYAISNNKVSKIHAEFIVRDNEYFVKDCNSTNGTYINGSTQRIASNVEHQIYDGDRITLANVELTLKCK